jgi:glycosyltransferase involved in cell wall biosynthesis
MSTASLSGAIAVLIPAFDEADALPAVLAALPSEACGLPVVAVVIDDGSEDQTADVAATSGARVERLGVNQGGGAALRRGFALARAEGAAFVVTMDADGQHLPGDLTRLLEPVVQGQADLAIGSRVLGSAEPNTFARELGIRVFNRLVSFLTRTQISDCSNGYRAMRAEILDSLDLRQEQFHTSEFLIQALARGIRVVEVPVAVARRTHGLTKKPRALGYGFGFARAIVVTWLRTRSAPAARPSRRTGHTPNAPEPLAPGGRDA